MGELSNSVTAEMVIAGFKDERNDHKWKLLSATLTEVSRGACGDVYATLEIKVMATLENQ